MKGLQMKRIALVLVAGGWLFAGCGDDEVEPPGTMTKELGACPGAGNWEIWVARQMVNDIKVVKGPEFSLDATKMIDLSGTGLKNPHGVVFNKEWTRAIVPMLGTPEAAYADGGVVLIDATNMTVLNSIVTRAKTHQTVFAPNGEIWAVNVNAPGSISFIDVATVTVTGKLEIGAMAQAVAVRFLADGTKGFLTDQSVEGENSKVHVISVAGKSLEGMAYKTGKVTVTPALTKDNSTLFVTNGMSNSISKIDLTMGDRNAAVTEFAKDLSEAHAIGLTSDKLFVTARMGARVSVFDAEGALLKAIPVTAAANPIPDMIAVAPTCSKVYVTERADGKLLQIDTETLEITGTVDLMGGYTHGLAVRTTMGDM
jgi:DNA-binding beta-propeller fold protein YncE